LTRDLRKLTMRALQNRNHRQVRRLIIAAAAGAIFLARPDAARAAQLRIPITIDYVVLREALKANP